LNSHPLPSNTCLPRCAYILGSWFIAVNPLSKYLVFSQTSLPLGGLFSKVYSYFDYALIDSPTDTSIHSSSFRHIKISVSFDPSNLPALIVSCQFHNWSCYRWYYWRHHSHINCYFRRILHATRHNRTRLGSKYSGFQYRPYTCYIPEPPLQFQWDLPRCKYSGIQCTHCRSVPPQCHRHTIQSPFTTSSRAIFSEPLLVSYRPIGFATASVHPPISQTHIHSRRRNSGLELRQCPRSGGGSISTSSVYPQCTSRGNSGIVAGDAGEGGG